MEIYINPQPPFLTEDYNDIDDKKALLSEISDLTSIRNPYREQYLNALKDMNKRFSKRIEELNGEPTKVAIND
jgi:hypothetical protein